jgi:hypothetical protein
MKHKSEKNLLFSSSKLAAVDLNLHRNGMDYCCSFVFVSVAGESVQLQCGT